MFKIWDDVIWSVDKKRNIKIGLKAVSDNKYLKVISGEVSDKMSSYIYLNSRNNDFDKLIKLIGIEKKDKQKADYEYTI